MPVRIANFNPSNTTVGSGQAQKPKVKTSSKSPSDRAINGLKTIYKGSVIGTGAVLLATGVVGNESLKTAYYLPAVIISVPSYAIGRYSAASVRAAMNYITNTKVDPSELTELNHGSGLNTAFAFTLLPLSAGLTMDLSTMAITAIFDELCYSGKRVLCYGLELGEESKDLENVEEIKFLSKAERLVSRLRPNNKERERYNLQLLKLFNSKNKIACDL
ncbi:MAG: hypothetical protein L7U87_00870 [Chlamydiales bacterium]|nr:hypothetical protein [Chlamydiales bacterium]